VAVVLTLVQKKQIRINIHKRNNTKNTVQTVQNIVNTILPKHSHIHTPTHYTTNSNTVQRDLKEFGGLSL
jgi:methyl coenzyme M reductase subunit D